MDYSSQPSNYGFATVPLMNDDYFRHHGEGSVSDNGTRLPRSMFDLRIDPFFPGNPVPFYRLRANHLYHRPTGVPLLPPFPPNKITGQFFGLDPDNHRILYKIGSTILRVDPLPVPFCDGHITLKLDLDSIHRKNGMYIMDGHHEVDGERLSMSDILNKEALVQSWLDQAKNTSSTRHAMPEGSLNPSVDVLKMNTNYRRPFPFPRTPAYECLETQQDGRVHYKHGSILIRILPPPISALSVRWRFQIDILSAHRENGLDVLDGYYVLDSDPPQDMELNLDDNMSHEELEAFGLRVQDLDRPN